MQLSLSILACLLQANTGFGHFTFSKIMLNGTVIGGDYEYIRKHTNYINPFDYTPKNPSINTTEFRCNKGVKDGTGTKVLNVTAGDTVGLKLFNPGYTSTLDHPGPTFIYLSKAPDNDVVKYDGSSDWFKIYESGMCAQNGEEPYPGRDWCLWDKDQVNFVIPKSLPPGQYLVRPELFAIHYANAGEIQFYLSCAQINVVSSGGGKPGPLVKIPGMYTGNEQAFHYSVLISPPYPKFIMPGPTVWVDGQ